MPDKARVLCVDDRADALLVRKMMLEQFGCEVATVNDGPSCLRTLEQQPIDLVLIDYHLAGGSTGEDLARIIRGGRPSLPLIMLTGDPAVPSSARESVDVLLIKGASSPGELLDAIQKLVPSAAIRPRGWRFFDDAANKAS